jgi:hypothetical protein
VSEVEASEGLQRVGSLSDGSITQAAEQIHLLLQRLTGQVMLLSNHVIIQGTEDFLQNTPALEHQYLQYHFANQSRCAHASPGNNYVCESLAHWGKMQMHVDEGIKAVILKTADVQKHPYPMTDALSNVERLLCIFKRLQKKTHVNIQ